MKSFLRAVLVKITSLIPADLACVALAEDSDGQRWVIVRDAEDYIVGAEAGDFTRYVNRLRVGGEDLPQGERSFMGFVAYTGKPRRTGNVRLEPCYRVSNQYVESELAVPIRFHGQTLGVLNLESKKQNAFCQDDEDQLNLIAQLIALPLHGLMMEEGVRRPNLTVLEQLASHFRSAPVGIPLAATQVLNDVACSIALAFESQLCRISLLRNNVLTVAGSTKAIPGQDTNWSERADILSSRAVQQRCLITSIKEVQSENSSRQSESDTSSSSLPMMATPMFVFDEPVGAIVVGGRRMDCEDSRRTYLGSDLQLLSTIQSQVAAYIKVKDVETTRREQSADRSRRASEISRIFVEPYLETVLQKTVLKVPNLCKAQYCSVFLWEPSKKCFTLAASTGLGTDLIGVAEYAPGEGLTGWVGKHGRSLILDSRGKDVLAKIAPDLSWMSKYDEADSPPNSPFNPFAAVPIFLNGEIRGVLRLSGNETGSFNEDDEFLLALVAAKIATAIEHSEAYKQRIQLLDALKELIKQTRHLNGSNIKNFLQRAASEAAAAFDADLVVIHSVMNGTFQGPPIWHGDVRDHERLTSRLQPDSVPESLLLDGVSAYWSDARGEDHLMRARRPEAPARVPRFVEREDIVSSAGVVLRVGKEPVGVMFLNYRRFEAFDVERRELLEVFACQVALAMETAGLYDQVQAIASREVTDQIGLELHNVIQWLSLTLIRHIGSILDKASDPAFINLRQDLRILERHAEDGIAELRGLLGELCRFDGPIPSPLQTIPDYIKRIAPRGITIRYAIDDKLHSVAHALQRLLVVLTRELVGNAVAYAQAKTIEVFLSVGAENVILKVRDEGIGFDREKALGKRGSFGLKGLYVRTDRWGGTVDLNSQPGHGTTAIITIPLAKRASFDVSYVE